MESRIYNEIYSTSKLMLFQIGITCFYPDESGEYFIIFKL